MRKLVPICMLLSAIFTTWCYGQDKGQLSGDFTLNANFYDYDSIVGTSTTQYFHEKSSAESWLFLNYRINGFSVAVRFDLFNNSPLLNPQEAFTAQGIGYYSISKKMEKWDFTVGHFYDQIGSGAIFRAYEDRTIGLDYAIQGARVQYTPNDSFMIKAFTGLQKNRLQVWPQVIKGGNMEKIWGLGPISMASGIGIVNRTLDQATMNILADNINALPLGDRFVPKYNVYAGTVYNTFKIGDFSLYGEYAQKTKEAVLISNSEGLLELKNEGGNVIYGAASYSTSGIGVNVQYKRIDKFILRTSPYTSLLQGVFGYLPALSKQHAYRLPARYSISALPEGETGLQAEVTYSINKFNTFDFNYSRITKLNGERLFREYWAEYTLHRKNIKAIMGVQSIIYDQEEYQFKPKVPLVYSLTPFLEMNIRLKAKPITKREDGTLKIPLRPSIRFELQYLRTRQDLGSFAYGLVEFNLAPKYSISLSDMANVEPVKSDKIIHYPSIFVFYTYRQSRVNIGYAKQVEGVVCTGGVCRVEPAFSGVRFGITTNF